MRILHVIPSLSPLDGGPPQAVLDFVRAGLEAGAQVDVATSTSPGEPIAPWPITAKTGNGTGQLHLFPRCALAGGLKFSWALTRWVFAHAKDYDLLHVHYVFSTSAPLSCLAALAARKPYVLMPHGSLDPWSLGRSSWKKRPYMLLMAPLLARASALHAASAKEVGSLAAMGLGSLARLVPLGVDLPDPPQPAAPAPTPRPLALLFLARLHPVKGLPTLLDALALLRAQNHPCTLTIAGDGHAEYRDALARQIQTLGLESAVRFLGFVEGADKDKAFAQADIFVLPSLQENFGLSAVEALGHGLPVVLSDQVPLSAEVLAHHAGEVAAVGSPQSFAEALTRLFDPARRAQAAQNALALARSSYGREATQRALMSLYAEVLHGAGTQQERPPQDPAGAGAPARSWVRRLGRPALWALRSLNFVLLSVWHGLLGARSLPLSPGRALVLAPHPDDESLGCGGLLAAKTQAGIPCLAVILTDGRHGVSTPRDTPNSQGDVAALRQGECLAAARELGLALPPIFLGCEDGSLSHLAPPEREALVQRLAAVLREFQPEEIYLPNPCDCHPDHEACLGLAGQALALAEHQAQVYGYFIWAFWCLSWHWRRGKRLTPLLRLNISGAVERKRRAMHCHASQMPRLPWVVRNGSLITRGELYCLLKPGTPGQGCAGRST